MSAELQQRIDELILESTCSKWLKVARIVGDVKVKSAGHNLNVTSEEIADRLAKLVAAGNLESQGNIANLRFSEVRLPE